MHKISIPRGALPKIANHAGVTTRTVQSALSFATEGEQPDLIRHIAMKYYNGIVVKRPIKLYNTK